MVTFLGANTYALMIFLKTSTITYELMMFLKTPNCPYLCLAKVIICSVLVLNMWFISCRLMKKVSFRTVPI